MPKPLPVTAPGGFAPLAAIGFSKADATLSAVSTASPLPVITQSQPAATPLSGTASDTTVTGPFVPTSGQPVILALSGNWTGTVQVMRSTDGGKTQIPLTVAGRPWASFTANCCEAVWEEGSAEAELYLQIALTSGTLNYRIEQ